MNFLMKALQSAINLALKLKIIRGTRCQSLLQWHVTNDHQNIIFKNTNTFTVENKSNRLGVFVFCGLRLSGLDRFDFCGWRALWCKWRFATRAVSHFAPSTVTSTKFTTPNAHYKYFLFAGIGSLVICNRYSSIFCHLFWWYWIDPQLWIHSWSPWLFSNLNITLSELTVRWHIVVMSLFGGTAIDSSIRFHIFIRIYTLTQGTNKVQGNRVKTLREEDKR